MCVAACHCAEPHFCVYMLMLFGKTSVSLNMIGVVDKDNNNNCNKSLTFECEWRERVAPRELQTCVVLPHTYRDIEASALLDPIRQ